MRKKKQKKAENNERWLLTYSDMITLLVALFVMLYALSNINVEKYKQLAESLNSAVGNGKASTVSVLNGSSGILDGGQAVISPDESTADTDAVEETEAADSSQTSDAATEEAEAESQEEAAAAAEAGVFKQLETDVSGLMANSGIQQDVYISTEERGLVISFTNNVFFDSGKASIKDEMKGLLNQVAGALNTIPNNILIEGHTDNIPISNNNFSSNWQLSSVRAANVAQYMVDNDGLDPTRITAAGCGEYKPIAPNDTEDGRQKNRRISIVILYKYVEQ